jgi:hypothetical protein
LDLPASSNNNVHTRVNDRDVIDHLLGEKEHAVACWLVGADTLTTSDSELLAINRGFQSLKQF